MLVRGVKIKTRCIVCLIGTQWTAGSSKTERFAVRLTAEQDALIRRRRRGGGDRSDQLRGDGETLAHAREVLADRRLFMLDASAWSEFVAVLDRPVSRNRGWRSCSRSPRSLTSERLPKRALTDQRARCGRRLRQRRTYPG